MALVCMRAQCACERYSAHGHSLAIVTLGGSMVSKLNETKHDRQWSQNSCMSTEVFGAQSKAPDADLARCKAGT